MGDECFERKKMEVEEWLIWKNSKNVVEDDFECFWMTNIGLVEIFFGLHFIS